jgi:predicted dehydrogenase
MPCMTLTGSAGTNPLVDIEDNLWALIRFGGRGSGSVGVSWTAPSAHIERGVIGSKGILRILEQKYMTGINAKGEKIDVSLGDDYDWFDVFVRESRDIVRCVAEGKPFSIDARDGRDTLEVSLAVQQSAMQGKLVHLPLETE